MDIIGKRFPRIDALSKATGEAVYVQDISLPRMLHAKILRSPHPHARILSIDTSRAEALPGVKGVITWRDISADKKRSFYGAFKPDETPLATDKVRFIGDEIAAVAAVDEACAQEALELIDVSYQLLPAVFDPEGALKEEAPQIHKESPGNISWRLYQDLGNLEEGLKQADHIQEDRFVTGFQCHAPLEPHAAMAQFDGDGRLNVWSSNQRPFFVSWDLAEALGMPQSNVRVIKLHIGGAFGGKMETSTAEFSVAYLARKTGRPVKVVLTREEEFVAMRRRHASVIYIKTGVKRDGTITARSCRAIFDGGAYNSVGIVAVFLSALFQNMPYRIRNLRYEAVRAYTNNTPCGAMRGFGTPQTYFAVETHMDRIAEALKMDPLELRLKNGLEAGEVTANGMKVLSSGYKESVRMAAASAQWDEKRKEQPLGSGIGMGSGSFLSGPRLRRLPRHTDAYSFSATLLYAHGDGKVSLVTGSTDIGQGSDSILAQIAAEELGISYEHISVEAGDTNISPLDYGTYGSRVTMMAGNATLNAAKDLKAKIVRAVAEQLKMDSQDISVAQDFVFSKASPETKIPFSEAVIICQRSLGGRPLIGEGCFNPEFEGVLDIKGLTEQGMGNYSPTYSFGTHVVEVAVDQETGQVEVGKMIVAHDCGTPINPMAVEGQLQGSVAMGHGYALTEQVRLDNGLMLNPSFLEYAIPTALDLGPSEIRLVDVYDPIGPFGAKEAGEGPVSPTAPSIVNAIHHATGVWITEIPVDSHKLLKEMRKENRGKKGMDHQVEA